MKITIIFKWFVVFDVETFEFSVPANLILIFLSIEYRVSFYWGQARVNFDSSLWIAVKGPKKIWTWTHGQKIYVFSTIISREFLEKSPFISKNNYSSCLCKISGVL